MRGGWNFGFFARTTNPKGALQNPSRRDRMFTDRLRKEGEDFALCAIQVNTAMAEDDSTELVTKIFGL
jgi:hypothetical protein